MWIPVPSDPRQRTVDATGQDRLVDAVARFESDCPRALIHRCHDKWQGGQMMMSAESVVLETLFDTNKYHDFTPPSYVRDIARGDFTVVANTFKHKRAGVIFFTIDEPYVFTKARKDVAYAFGFVSIDLRSHPFLSKRIAEYLIWDSRIPGLSSTECDLAMSMNPRLKSEHGVHTIGIPKRGWLKFRKMVAVYMHHFPDSGLRSS